MRPFFIFLSLATVLCSPLCSQDLEQLKSRQDLRLKEARERLSALREDTTQTILPLQKELRSLRNEERKWRKQYEEHQSVEDSRVLSLDDLKAALESSREELQYLENVLLREFFAEHRSSLPLHSHRSDELRKLDLKIESGTLAEEEIVPAQVSSLLDVARDLVTSHGGHWNEGQALAEDGAWHQGRILDLGPEAFFQSEDRSKVGLLSEGEDHRVHIDPRVSKESINTWMQNDRGLLPFDVTGGQALLALETKTSFLEHVEKGGIWVIPIIFFATLSALIALFKMVVLYSVKVSPIQVGHRIAQLLRKEELTEALSLAESQPTTCRSMWKRAIEEGQADPDLTEEIMTESILEIQPAWERFHGMIALTAAVAPLLGLLGTVTGIIKTFQMMEVFGAGDPRPLIGGISEALITTELGLILAIPALLLHALLSRRAQSLLSRLERCSLATVNGLMGASKTEDA